MTSSGHVILNQCGTYLTHKKYEIKGISKHELFLQQICDNSIGHPTPLVYPEAIIFTSFFWWMTDTSCSIFWYNHCSDAHRLVILKTCLTQLNK